MIFCDCDERFCALDELGVGELTVAKLNHADAGVDEFFYESGKGCGRFLAGDEDAEVGVA